MKRHLLMLPLTGIVLFAALWTYVQSDSFAERIRPLIAGPLQEVMGPGARVGWIKANLLPPYLEVRDIIIPAGATSDAVTVRKIKVYFNPFPLLWKKISIPSITVLEPRVTATRSPDGSVDVVDLIRTIAGNIGRRGARGPSSWEIDIRTVGITNGTARFSDVSSKGTVQLTHMNLSARLRGRGTIMDIRSVGGHIVFNAPAYPRIEADFRAAMSVDQRSIRIREASLSSPDMRLAAAGDVGLGPEDAMQLKLSFRAGGPQRTILKFLKQKAARQQPDIDVSLTVTGRRDSPLVDGTARVGNMPYGRLVLKEAAVRFSYRDHAAEVSGQQWNVTRNDRSIRIKTVQVKVRYEKGVLLVDGANLLAEDAELAASGNIDPASGYDLEVSGLSWGDGIALSVLSGIDIRGDLSAAGRLTGKVAQPRFSGGFSGGPFNVRGVPFTSVTGSLIYADAVLSLEDAAVVQGRARYALEGSVNISGPSAVFDATLKADHADVASIVALFTKRLPLDIAASGTLSFSGTVAEFSGSAKLVLDAGSAYGESFDTGTVTAELSSTKISFPSVVVRKKGGTVRGSGWIGFDRTYAARIESTGVDVAAIDRLKPASLSGPLDLTVTSSGSFSRPIVKAHADVSSLFVRDTEAGTAKCDLTIEEGRLGVSLAVKSGRGASSDLTGTMKLTAPYVWSASGKVHAADLDAASFSSTSELLAKTRISADANVELAGSGADIDAITGVLQIPQVALLIGDYRVENEGDLRIRMRGGRLVVDSFVLSGLGTKVTLAGSAGLSSGLDLTLTGDASLSLLRFSTRAIEHGDGMATANVRITEAWSDPNITGEVTVKNGLIKIKDVPQRFSALSGTVTFDRNRIVIEGLRGDFGGGTVSVNGNVQMKNLKLVDFTSKARLENVTFRYPPGLTATLGGTLYYDGDRESQTLSGEVTIVRARYERRVDFKTMLVDLSRGFKPKTKEELSVVGDTKLDIHLVGKENILLENNLAKIPFEMDMLFRGTVNRVQVLGHIDARKGDVYFRKNVFHILHGSADFADLNRINPVLDVEAETQVREYQIRLTVTGSADRATVSFASEPPLSDANIFALLTIGRKSEDIRGKEAEVGGGEAIGIVTGPVQDILESRARNLTGLDRFQVDPYFSKADVAVPRVTAGKELVRDRLYVTYSANVGASNPEQAFNIEYLMNKNMSLVGGRNDIGDIGADIKFRFGFR